MEAAAKVTSKGQVTFQRSLGIKEGDEIVFRVEQPGPPRQDDGLLGTSRHGESPGRDAERGLGRRTPPHKDRQGGCSSLERSWTRTSWFDTDWRSARDGRSGHGLGNGGVIRLHRSPPGAALPLWRGRRWRRRPSPAPRRGTGAASARWRAPSRQRPRLPPSRSSAGRSGAP